MLPLVAPGARSVANAVANVAVDEAKICAVVACIAAVAAGAAPRATSNAKCRMMPKRQSEVTIGREI